MLIYLFSKYLQLTILICVVLLGMHFLLGLQDPLLKAVFWSGLIGIYATYRYFKWQNHWVIYLNLRYPVWLLLAVSATMFEIASLTIVILLRGSS